MTDKVQKIKEWISKEQEGLMDTNGNFEYPEHEGAYHILCNLDAYIDSLQEEPVSEELEDAADKYSQSIHSDYSNDMFDSHNIYDAVIYGANWQRQKMIKDAVEATVHGVSGREGSMMKGIAVTAYADVPDCKFGDKVKLIIIKED